MCLPAVVAYQLPKQTSFCIIMNRHIGGTYYMSHCGLFLLFILSQFNIWKEGREQEEQTVAASPVVTCAVGPALYIICQLVLNLVTFPVYYPIMPYWCLAEITKHAWLCPNYCMAVPFVVVFRHWWDRPHPNPTLWVPALTTPLCVTLHFIVDSYPHCDAIAVWEEQNRKEQDKKRNRKQAVCYLFTGVYYSMPTTPAFPTTHVRGPVNIFVDYVPALYYYY